MKRDDDGRSRVLDTRAAVVRMSVAGVVPLLAVAAHGFAGGELPTSSGLVLLLAIGLIAGLAVRGAGRLGVVTVLTAAQIACHGALAISHGHPMTADVAVGGATPMLLTHLVAVPLSAIVIVAVAQLISLITSVMRTIVTQRGVEPGDTYRCGYAAPLLLRDTQRARAHAVRGPPTWLHASFPFA